MAVLLSPMLQLEVNESSRGGLEGGAFVSGLIGELVLSCGCLDVVVELSGDEAVDTNEVVVELKPDELDGESRRKKLDDTFGDALFNSGDIGRDADDELGVLISKLAGRLKAWLSFSEPK